MAATYFFGVKESTAAANKRHLCVFNPVASGKTMVLYGIKAAGAPTAAVAGLTVALTCVRVTSAPTGGTAVTEVDAVNANPAPGMTAQTAATGGAAEAAGYFGCGVVSGEETASTNESTLYDSVYEGERMTFAPGEGFLVKQGTLASAGAISVVARVGVTPP